MNIHQKGPLSIPVPCYMPQVREGKAKQLGEMDLRRHGSGRSIEPHLREKPNRVQE